MPYVGWIVRYYQGGEIVGVRTVAELKNALGQQEGGAWVVDRAGPTGRLEFPWLSEHAEMRVQLGNRVWQPHSTVRIFYYAGDGSGRKAP